MANWLGGPADRPLLIFMHGAPMDHRMFNAQVMAFAPDYRVLTWDARGHGRSRPVGNGFSLELCTADMLAILDEIGAAQAILCGQSLGGYIAQHIYILAPQRVRAMIIIGSTPLAKAYSRGEIWALKATVSLLLVHSEHDLTGTIKRDMPLWAEWERDAEFHIIPASRHNANQDNTAVTNQLIAAFLQKHINLANMES